MTPSRHTPLESSRHLETEVDGEAGLTSRPIFISRPLLQARVRLSAHISGGTMLPGAPAQVVRGAQERGPLESMSPCCAVHSLYDCLLGESRVHVGQGQPLCKWVSSSALSRVSEPRPPKRPPTRRLLLPRTGLAHGAGLDEAHLTYQLLPVRARDSLLRVATVPPSAPTVGPGPPAFLVLASLLPRPRSSPSLLVLAPPSFYGPAPPPPSWSLPLPPSTAAFLPLPPPFLFRVPPSVHGPCLPLPPPFLSRAPSAALAPVRPLPPRTCVRELGT